MPEVADIEQKLAQLDFLHGRSSQTTPAQEDAAFAKLAYLLIPQKIFPQSAVITEFSSVVPSDATFCVILRRFMKCLSL